MAKFDYVGIEELGHETLMMLDSAGSTFTIRLAPDAGVSVRPGDKLSLCLTKPKLLFFDAVSGDLIALQ